jgi:molybdenum cofactor synthesis domain-containing protein
LTIGNEILLGLIEDTNSSYLCRLVRGMGGRVRHIAIVRDEIDAIALELRDSMERATQLIFTCGGLGPTDDDVTLAGVAQATARKLEVHEQASEFVAGRYRELARKGYVRDAEMSEERLKMARLPQGARAIENPVGAAPAVMLQIGETRIVSLPGVRSELKAIVEGPLHVMLAEVFGQGSYREVEMTVQCGDESALAPALRMVAAMHPEVYIKSRASHFGPDVRFRILISASAADAAQAALAIKNATTDLKRTLEDSGILKQADLSTEGPRRAQTR